MLLFHNVQISQVYLGSKPGGVIKVLDQFDPFKSGGAGGAIIRKFKSIATDGGLTIALRPIVQNPQIAGVIISGYSYSTPIMEDLPTTAGHSPPSDDFNVLNGIGPRTPGDPSLVYDPALNPKFKKSGSNQSAPVPTPPPTAVSMAIPPPAPAANQVVPPSPPVITASAASPPVAMANSKGAPSFSAPNAASPAQGTTVFPTTMHAQALPNGFSSGNYGAQSQYGVAGFSAHQAVYRRRLTSFPEPEGSATEFGTPSVMQQPGPPVMPGEAQTYSTAGAPEQGMQISSGATGGALYSSQNQAGTTAGAAASMAYSSFPTSEAASGQAGGSFGGAPMNTAGQAAPMGTSGTPPIQAYSGQSGGNNIATTVDVTNVDAQTMPGPPPPPEGDAMLPPPPVHAAGVPSEAGTAQGPSGVQGDMSMQPAGQETGFAARGASTATAVMAGGDMQPNVHTQGGATGTREVGMPSSNHMAHQESQAQSERIQSGSDGATAAPQGGLPLGAHSDGNIAMREISQNSLNERANTWTGGMQNGGMGSPNGQADNTMNDNGRSGVHMEASDRNRMGAAGGGGMAMEGPPMQTASRSSDMAEGAGMRNEGMGLAPAGDMEGGMVSRTGEERQNNGGGFQDAAPTANNPVTHSVNGGMAETRPSGNEGATVRMGRRSITEERSGHTRMRHTERMAADTTVPAANYGGSFNNARQIRRQGGNSGDAGMGNGQGSRSMSRYGGPNAAAGTAFQNDGGRKGETPGIGDGGAGDASENAGANGGPSNQAATPGIHNHGPLEGICLENSTHCSCGMVAADPAHAEECLFVVNDHANPMTCVRRACSGKYVCACAAGANNMCKRSLVRSILVATGGPVTDGTSGGGAADPNAVHCKREAIEHGVNILTPIL